MFYVLTGIAGAVVYAASLRALINRAVERSFVAGVELGLNARQPADEPAAEPAEPAAPPAPGSLDPALGARGAHYLEPGLDKPYEARYPRG